MSYMKSTDRDLLVAQKMLSEIRWPDKAVVMAKEYEKRYLSLKNRFVQASFGDGRQVVVQVKSPRSRLAMYDLGVSFQVKNILLKGIKYKATVHFVLLDVPGEGMTGAACLQGAKERFRKHLVEGLRARGSDMQKRFFNEVKIAFMNGYSVGPNKVTLEVAEKFRVWIGNQLWHLDTNIRKRFHGAVRHEEVHVTHTCIGCDDRKPDFSFNKLHREEMNEYLCLECKPLEKEVDEDCLEEPFHS